VTSRDRYSICDVTLRDVTLNNQRYLVMPSDKTRMEFRMPGQGELTLFPDPRQKIGVSRTSVGIRFGGHAPDQAPVDVWISHTDLMLLLATMLVHLEREGRKEVAK
jgi:hypothetical protein